jgi:hypothetical protein
MSFMLDSIRLSLYATQDGGFQDQCPVEEVYAQATTRITLWPDGSRDSITV